MVNVEFISWIFFFIIFFVVYFIFLKSNIKYKVVLIFFFDIFNLLLYCKSVIIKLFLYYKIYLFYKEFIICRNCYL